MIDLKYNFLLKEFNIVHNYNKNVIISHYVSLKLYDDKKIEFLVDVNNVSNLFLMMDQKLEEYFYNQRIMKINKIMNIVYE